MSFENEFETVEILLKSNAETRGVDAFSISLIKAERQMRKIFTFLIFQFPCFDKKDVANLRNQLFKERRIYFNHFIQGIDRLSPTPVSELIGDDYKSLLLKMEISIDHRNKIFHGQLTDKSLNSNQIIEEIKNISNWCNALAAGAMTHIGYDGFIRNSFQKSTIVDLHEKFKVKISSVDDYGDFLKSISNPKK